MLRRLAETSGLIFGIVFAWKVALLLFTAQPVPNNDAFFYDGPVVNYLRHGQYSNPTLVHALPISGGEVFAAYPPLYQAVLLGWMSAFGTSAFAAMALHVGLIGIYFWIVHAILRRLQVPPLGINLAGLFLFGITFHDRPDTVAHVFGVLSVWGLIRGGKWTWLAALGMAFSFCASLQIGAVYVFWCGLIAVGNVWSGRATFPWLQFAVAGMMLMAAVALVRFNFPHLWAGFQEHVKITPSLGAWRWPGFFDTLKAIRTAPASFAVVALMVWVWSRKPIRSAELMRSPADLLAVSGCLVSLSIIGASLIKLSPNTIHITNYLQPLVVGAMLGGQLVVRRESGGLSSWLTGGAILLALFTGIRAIGMSTWGVWCAHDVSYTQARDAVRAVVAPLPPDSTVIASSAYLYDLATRTNITIVHDDWAAVPGDAGWEARAYAKLKPATIVLTQFDYYRRFGGVIEELRTHPELASLTLTNLAGVRAPDSFPKFQRVVQHVSWAPVIVELKWR